MAGATVHHTVANQAARRWSVAEEYDVVIVGAGLVGLSTAYPLLLARPGLRGVHRREGDKDSLSSERAQFRRPALGSLLCAGSLRAQLCRTGKASLERFAEAHDIPFRQCGKLIIAIDEGELGRLAKLGERGRANGVEGLVEVGSERIRELEPHATGIRALWSPRTAIIDFGAVAAAYAAEIGDHGGKIMLGHRVTAIRPRGTWHILATSSQDVVTRKVISCAGLQSDRVAAMTGTRGGARIIPFRGDYYRLRPAARHLVRGLIYPVPDPSLPFLGVHFTARVNGDVWAGPNAVLALAPEGYQRWHINVADVAIVRFGGFWRMLRRHLHAGVAEGWRDVIKAAVVRQLQRYVPDIRGHQLIFGPSGVRAQLVGEDGRLVDDFHLDESAHVMHLRNAPSPPATACDALGTILAEKAIDRFGLP